MLVPYTGLQKELCTFKIFRHMDTTVSVLPTLIFSSTTIFGYEFWWLNPVICWTGSIEFIWPIAVGQWRLASEPFRILFTAVNQLSTEAPNLSSAAVLWWMAIYTYYWNPEMIFSLRLPHAVYIDVLILWFMKILYFQWIKIK